MAITTEILGGDVQLSGIPVYIKCSGGAAPANSLEYKILLQVVDVDNKLLAPPDPDAEAPDSNGEVVFNIQGIVDQPVNSVFEYPLANAYVAYPTQAFSIKVKAGERWVDDDPSSATYGDIIETWGAESAAFQILKGGVSQRQIAMWEADTTNFYETYIAAGKFLTHRPWGDFVHPTQPVKLWFIPGANATANFKVKGVYDDGTDTTYTTPVNLDSTKLYEFNCNPAFLGLTMEPTGKKMEYFDVEIEGKSDSRRFTIDWRPCERPFFIFFANSIGGVDDVYLSGYAQDKFAVETTVLKRSPQPGDSVQDPTLVTPASLGQNQWVINTGVKTNTQMLHLRDLMVSRQKWLLFPNDAVSSYIVIPIIINNSNAELINRMEYLHDLDLEIAEADKSQFSFDNRLY